jgi:hypothetical protein
MPSYGGSLTFGIDRFIVKNFTISNGKLTPSQTTEYLLTNFDHPMTLEEESKYMNGEIHQLFHNQEKGWVHVVKAGGEKEQKWRPTDETNTPLLATLKSKLTPFLDKFPQRFISIFYSQEVGVIRIRFHPQENENAEFYGQMMDLLNSNL